MSEELVLPPRMTVLGEAMCPMLEKVKGQIDQCVPHTETVVDMGEVVLRHLRSLQDTIPRLTDRINRLMGDVVTNDDACDVEIYRAVGRFEAFLDDLLADYRSVQALNAYGDGVEARDLLAGVYRHTLMEIRNWLAELVETLADPMAAVIKRGLPTTGHVELTLTMTLTAAPQLERLTRWAECHATVLSGIQYGSSPPPVRKSGLGFWGTVGMIALGWGISDAFFGDHDCGCDKDS